MWFGGIRCTMKKIGFPNGRRYMLEYGFGLGCGTRPSAGEGEACLAQAPRCIWSDAGGDHMRPVHWISDSGIPSEMKTLLTGVSISFKQTVLPVLKERGIPYTSSVT